MEVQRFEGKDSKGALDQVRAHFGADALILSTVRKGSNVEVAAVSGKSFIQNDVKDVNSASAKPTNEITLGYLNRELKSLREVLFKALGDRAWGDVAGKRPVLSALEQRLSTLGFGRVAINYIVARVDSGKGLNVAWASALDVLKSRIKFAPAWTAKSQLIIGGTSSSRSTLCQQIITSAGKEGQLAQVVLLSATDDPSGALIDFCRRYKVKRVHLPKPDDALAYLEKHLKSKRIVIEAGDLKPSLGLDDPALQLISGSGEKVETILMLSALQRSDVLRSVIDHANPETVAGAVISDIAESDTLGAVLDSLVLHDIRLLGISDARESLVTSVNFAWFINRAKRLAKEKLEKEEYLRAQSSHWTDQKSESV